MSTTEAPTAVSTAAPTAAPSTGPAPGTTPADPAASSGESTPTPNSTVSPTAELGPTAEFEPPTGPAPEGPAPVPTASAPLSPQDSLASLASTAGPVSPAGPVSQAGPGTPVRPVSTPPATLGPNSTIAAPAAPTSVGAATTTQPAPAQPAPSGPRTRRPMRADARRNYDRLLAAADAAFTQHGAEASLEDIARRAAVGIGTLYRHFPTRQILLEATFGGRLDALRDEADALGGTEPPMPALTTWLRSLLRYVTEFRGLSELVMTTMRNHASDLHASGIGMRRAGGRLLARAQATGEVRPDLDDADLILMVNGIVWAAERVPGEDHAQRLLAVMIDGLRPSRIAAA